MGTWDDGLYDNDSALDELWLLVKIDGDEPDAVRLAARIGLLAWLNPVSVTHGAVDLRARVSGLAEGERARLPEATWAALRRLLDDPGGVIRERARTAAARAVIGGYSDGPRIDALLRFPGAEAVIDGLGERAAARLDVALQPDVSAYEIAGDLAALGVLIELAEADLWRPAPARVAAWRVGLDAIDRATREERSFWWKYFVRVRRGLDLVGPPAPAAAPARAIVRRKRPAEPPPAAGPVERFAHPKFGVGVLVSRSGSGDAAALELRFEDGTVRRILARFVTAVDDAGA